MRARSGFLSSTGAILLLCLAMPALAGDQGASKRAFARARHAYALGEFDEALSLFKEAYDAAPLPGLLFNIAQCHRNLGHTAQAIFFYERYLEEHPDPPDEEQVRALVDELRASERVRQAAPPLDARPPPENTTPIAAPPIAPVEDRPITEKWWFWTALVATAAAVTGATVIAVRATQHDDLPDDPIATIDYRSP